MWTKSDVKAGTAEMVGRSLEAKFKAKSSYYGYK